MNNPMWFCDFDQCDKAAVRILGDCLLCNQHLCSKHLQKPFHTCPTPEHDDVFYQATAKAQTLEIAELIQKINLNWLQYRASSLRHNIPCHIQDPTKESSTIMMGGMNLHLLITFEDGIHWLLRIRRSNATSPPPTLQTYIFNSEIATLKFLETTSIPTPRVYDYAIDAKDSPAGIGYILMEFMSETVLEESSISEEGRRKVTAQLADIYIELRKYEFEKMGCLHQIGDKESGAFAREGLTDCVGPSRKMQPLGPFTHLQDYYTACIGLLLDLIHRGEIHTNNSVDVYLIYKYLLDIVPEIYPREDVAEAKEESTKFYLKHADDKGFHILVDDNSNITALIDWEWAFAAPAPVAFNSPMLLLPTSDFFNGSTEIGNDEKFFAECLQERGAEDMAKAVRQGRLQHQVAFLCTLDFCLSLEDMLGLFKGLRNSLKKDYEYDWEEWRRLYLKRYEHDGRLKDILARSGY